MTCGTTPAVSSWFRLNQILLFVNVFDHTDSTWWLYQCDSDQKSFVWNLWAFVVSETKDYHAILSGFWWTFSTLWYRMNLYRQKHHRVFDVCLRDAMFLHDSCFPHTQTNTTLQPPASYHFIQTVESILCLGKSNKIHFSSHYRGYLLVHNWELLNCTIMSH